MADEQHVEITPRMEQIIRHMLTNPRAKYYTARITADAGIPEGSTSALMRRMEAAGWLTSQTEPRQQYAPRRYYRFTPGSASMLRKAVG